MHSTRHCAELVADLIVAAFDPREVGDQPLGEVVRVSDAALPKPQRTTDA
jgi:hypothetical protein